MAARRGLNVSAQTLIMKMRTKLLAFILIICGAYNLWHRNHSPTQYFLENTMTYYAQEWPHEVLNAFKEPTFIHPPKDRDEQFRFMLLRALHHSPVIIRIEHTSNDVTKIYAKVGLYVSEQIDGEISGPPVKYIHTYEGVLSDEDYIKFTEIFAALNICDDNLEKQRGGLDGSTWLFEYRNHKKHCQHYTWVPKEKAKHDVAEFMISLAKMPIEKIGHVY